MPSSRSALRPTTLALRARSVRSASVNRTRLSFSHPLNIEFSAWRYSMTISCCRCTQPLNIISRNASAGGVEPMREVYRELRLSFRTLRGRHPRRSQHRRRILPGEQGHGVRRFRCPHRRASGRTDLEELRQLLEQRRRHPDRIPAIRSTASRCEALTFGKPSKLKDGIETALGALRGPIGARQS